MKTSELSGVALDWAVAKCEGAENFRFDGVAFWWFTLNGVDRVLSSVWSTKQNFNPSTNWAQGGPILSRQRINREFNHNSGLWQAFRGHGVMHTQQDSSELVAGMRCYVASHYGEEVEVPDELCQQDG